MTHIQNATLAGGVGAGAVAGLILYPWGALLLGCFAGVLSTLGYTYLQVGPPAPGLVYVSGKGLLCSSTPGLGSVILKTSTDKKCATIGAITTRYILFLGAE